MRQNAIHYGWAHPSQPWRRKMCDVGNRRGHEDRWKGSCGTIGTKPKKWQDLLAQFIQIDLAFRVDYCLYEIEQQYPRMWCNYEISMVHTRIGKWMQIKTYIYKGLHPYKTSSMRDVRGNVMLQVCHSPYMSEFVIYLLKRFSKIKELWNSDSNNANIGRRLYTKYIICWSLIFIFICGCCRNY